MNKSRLERDAEVEAEEPLHAAPEAAAGGQDEPEYRRRRSPVRVRRRRGFTYYCKHGWKPALWSALALAVAAALYSLVFASSWFVLQGSDQIAVLGTQHTDAGRVLAPFSADLGRNTFFIPLSARRREVEQIPWVRQAAVLRIWPARLVVRVTERTPVAFARAGDGMDLIDDQGVLLERPAGGQFSFPVLTGLAGISAPNPNAARWLVQRQAQVAQWLAFTSATAGLHAANQISEVNLSDPANLQVRVKASGSGAEEESALVDMGDRNFEPRFALFLSQIAGWRQKYPNLTSVDLRFDGQAIVDPGPAATASSPAAPAAPKHAAGARG